ncbi:hypothetical protein [Paenibacillus alginolyticus]|uniref:hypothetical protein n=1 Tax=Paenibacillus alginolyticus TaxID=59839 RepID=UPI002DB9106C|nr:hypothetical protein [Paenibacillus alginolyticus]MEC0145715.1 hypothetical protein [Paenibacillus alginolyticus]
MRGQIVHLACKHIGVEHVRVLWLHPDAVVVQHGNCNPVLLLIRRDLRRGGSGCCWHEACQQEPDKREYWSERSHNSQIFISTPTIHNSHISF